MIFDAALFAWVGVSWGTSRFYVLGVTGTDRSWRAQGAPIAFCELSRRKITVVIPLDGVDGDYPIPVLP